MHSSINMNPVLGPKFFPGGWAGAKGVALGRRSLGPQGVKVAEGEGIGGARRRSMVRTSG